MKIDLGRFLAKRGQFDGARTALIAGDARLSFSDLETAANRAANALQRHGVVAGDRVAVLLRNGIDYVALYYAAAKIGAILCGINWRLAAPEIDYILADAEPRLLIHDAEFAPTVAALADRRARRFLAGDPALQEAAGGAMPSTEGDSDRPLVLVYTSGTTGRPKGAVLTHGQMFWASATMAASHDYGQGDVNLVPTPLFHVGGLSFATLFVHMGATLLLPRVWEPGAILRAIAAERVNHFFAVPTMLRSLVEHGDFAAADFSSLRWILCGGSPVTADLVDAFAARGIPVQQTYGATETAGPATLVDAAHIQAKRGAAGLPYFHTDIRIAAPDGAESPAGTIGEVQVRAPHVFAGYWRNPAATAEAFAGAWFKTGDLGRRDADGYLFVVDRAKDMIKSGGENIYPAEIEAALAAHADIAEAAVVGTPDPHWGEIPCAVIVLKPGRGADADSLRQWCEARLARFKVPRRWEFREAPLPRNATGKLLKRAIRASLTLA
ncbi:MAG: long-chain-fatty-acid--CoA ligase [Rhodospirillaceae bacterium]|nr:long-chain-fatty-acid--CoA ligase [Rhodospirillaceae bacterium]